MRLFINVIFCIFVSCLLVQAFIPAVGANDGQVSNFLTTTQASVHDKVANVFSRLDAQKSNSRGASKKPVVREKWAILIGADRYQDSSINSLQYGRNSALLLEKSLKSPNYGHFHPNHVTILTGVNATREHILESLLGPTLIHKVLPSDLIVVYFATRMLPCENDDDLYICTYDTLASEASLSGISLADTLTKLKRRTQCPQIICVLDCAPAGDHRWDLEKTSRIAGLAKKTGVSFLLASDLGTESLSWAPSHFSYFAEFLAEGLKNTEGNVPLACLASYIQDSINNECQEYKLTPTKVSLSVAPDAPDMGLIVLGQQKHGINPQKVRFGYDVRNLPMHRPDLLVARTEPAKVAENRIVNGATADDDQLERRFGGADFDAYMDKMRRDIRSKWNPPKGLENRRIVAVFSILRDGSIVHSRIAEGSGIPEVDQTALEALKAASPLDHLPPSAAASVQVRYVFDRQVTSQ